jgi:CRP-like cAMP-binding protein
MYMESRLSARGAPGLIHRKPAQGKLGRIGRMHVQTLPMPVAAGSARVVDLLGHAPIFRGVPPADLARIAAGTAQLHAERGRILFRRGDACVGFHLVVFGQVKLAVGSAAGAEKVIDILGPGRSFGEAVMFSGNPYPVTATTLGDALLLHVGKEPLFAELDRDPQLARRMLAGLSMRLHMLVKDVEAMTLHSAIQRVIGYLASLEEDGGEGDSRGCVTLPAQKSLVASRLNLTPEYFSRILHDLAAEGLIRVDGRRIEIVDSGGLRAYGSEAA